MGGSHAIQARRELYLDGQILTSATTLKVSRRSFHGNATCVDSGTMIGLWRVFFSPPSFFFFLLKNCTGLRKFKKCHIICLLYQIQSLFFYCYFFTPFFIDFFFLNVVPWLLVSFEFYIIFDLHSFNRYLFFYPLIHWIYFSISSLNILFH